MNQSEQPQRTIQNSAWLMYPSPYAAMPVSAPSAAVMLPDGGIILPRYEALDSIFAASSAGNPDLFIAGIVMLPVAMTLPGPEPDKAPINALATTDT